jgi:TolB-like protein
MPVSTNNDGLVSENIDIFNQLLNNLKNKHKININDRKEFSNILNDLEKDMALYDMTIIKDAKKITSDFFITGIIYHESDVKVLLRIIDVKTAKLVGIINKKINEIPKSDYEIISIINEYSKVKQSIHSIIFAPFKDNSYKREYKGKEFIFYDLIADSLIKNSSFAISVVDRSEISRILSEQSLNLSGIDSSDDYLKSLRLTGADLIIFCSIQKSGNKIRISARAINPTNGSIAFSIFNDSSVGNEEKLCVEVGKQICYKIYEEIQR